MHETATKQRATADLGEQGARSSCRPDQHRSSVVGGLICSPAWTGFSWVEDLRRASGLFAACGTCLALVEKNTAATKNATSGRLVSHSPAVSSLDLFQNGRYGGGIIWSAANSIGWGVCRHTPHINGKSTTARRGSEVRTGAEYLPRVLLKKNPGTKRIKTRKTPQQTETKASFRI